MILFFVKYIPVMLVHLSWRKDKEGSHFPHIVWLQCVAYSLIKCAKKYTTIGVLAHVLVLVN